MSVHVHVGTPSIFYAESMRVNKSKYENTMWISIQFLMCPVSAFPPPGGNDNFNSIKNLMKQQFSKQSRGARGLGSMCRRLSKQSNKQHSELDLFFPIFPFSLFSIFRFLFPSSSSIFVMFVLFSPMSMLLSEFGNCPQNIY